MITNKEINKTKKEYAIYCIFNRGTPFILDTFKNINHAKIKLETIVQNDKARNRTYYIDNDFYDNAYSIESQGKYYSIIERTVSEWDKYVEIENNALKNKRNTNEKSKIIIFKNYNGA